MPIFKCQISNIREHGRFNCRINKYVGRVFTKMKPKRSVGPNNIPCYVIIKAIKTIYSFINNI